MSFLLPYSPDLVIQTFSTWFSIDLTTLSSFESLVLCVLSNLYFFIFWFFIIYFSLKLFYKIYERIF